VQLKSENSEFWILASTISIIGALGI